MMRASIFLLFYILLVSFVGDDKDRKIVSDDNFDYIFYVSKSKKTNYSLDKKYFWFKQGRIHATVGSSDGQNLHGKFKKKFVNGNLAEEGEFDTGLKDKVWKSWFDNGNLSKVENWNNGVISGKFKEFEKSGKLIITGSYKASKKHGTWINHSLNDTTYYKQGNLVQKKNIKKELEVKQPKENVISKASSFIKSLFKKKSSTEKATIERKKKARKIKKQDKKANRKSN